MNTSLKRAALLADGRSHRCEKCPLRPCSDQQYKVCGNAFVEGFRKGVKFKKEQINRKEKTK